MNKQHFNIVCYILLIVLAILLFKSCSRDPENKIVVGDKTVEVRLTTKIDTLYLTKNVYHRDTVKIPTLVKQDTVFVDGTKQVAIMPKIVRTYTDSLKVEDSVYVGYKAKVTGTLDNITLSYSNRKSIVVIHKRDSVIMNTTITKHAGGLYIGVDGGYNQFAPKLEYVKDKNIFSAGYNIINKSPQIGYSRKIF